MADTRIVVMFPGQGAFHGTFLKQAAEQYGEVAALLSTVDEVAVEVFGRRLTDAALGEPAAGGRELPVTDFWVSQLAVYACDLAAHAVLRSRGLRPDLLLGHSLGEIPALVAGGALDVRDGAWVTAQRVLALEALGAVDGGMVALGVDARRAAAVAELTDEHRLVVAVRNHADQTVLSGPDAALRTAEDIAKALRATSVRLPAAYPFHSPALQSAVADFAHRIRGVRTGALHTPVYSPIEGRRYTAEDDLMALIAQHLVRPVAFGDALRALDAEGFGAYVESGGLDTLARLVRRVLPAAQALPTFAEGPDGSRALEATLAELAAAGALPEPAAVLPSGLAALLPVGDPAGVERFWSARGEAIVRELQRQYAEFVSQAGGGVAAAAVAVTAPVAASVAVDAAAPVAAADPVLPADPVPAAAAATEPVCDRESLIAELGGMFATAMDYPVEVFGPDVLLEAELGIDSIKQVELLTRIADRYQVPEQATSFNQELDTLGKIADLVLAQSLQVAEVAR